jgi:predicted DCC family thiol-disulfide oxidoreductase YuxK
MTTLFQSLLGPSFETLPEPVRRFHTLERERFTGGRATVARPKGLGARLLSRIAGLPAPGHDVTTFVRFSPLGDAREFWRRDFAGRRYESIMRAAPDGRLIEHFGPFDLYFRLTPKAQGLAWSLDASRLLGVPLPRATAPRIDCFESADGDDFRFDIDVVFPLIGPVVQYSGRLRETPEAAPVWLYDGVCVFCSWSVRYALAHELTPSIRFVAIQSAEGRKLAKAHGVDADNPQSFLFVENGRALQKSDAVLALARQENNPPFTIPVSISLITSNA